MSQSVVVVGLGYVGLPLAFEACCNGFEVVGLDVSKDVLESLHSQRSHVDDIEDAQIKKMFDKAVFLHSNLSRKCMGD